MTLRLDEHSIHFSGQVTVEDAEVLLGWLLENPALDADLEQLEHLHLANLQVLMAAHCKVRRWPQSAALKTWLEAALLSEGRV